MTESPSHGWTPVWAMPNVTLDQPIEASHAALVPSGDERLRSIAESKPALWTFLTAFRDEFGNQIHPTIGMVREDSLQGVKTVTAFAGFRDAVCLSAIVAGRGVSLLHNSANGILHSEAFDVYPWFLVPELTKTITALTPALKGMHILDKLRPQSAPALGNCHLFQLDQPLLEALVARWEHCFATGKESVEDRRLFRALEMARAASKMPGGRDASEHDAGRLVALWVSAFEILAHDERQSSCRRVLLLLDRVEWLREKLKRRDREARVRKDEFVPSNLAGQIYGRLNEARNDFLHGNPVNEGTLKFEASQRPVVAFAAPLFRLALTAFLDLRMPKEWGVEGYASHMGKRLTFKRAQELMEDAILKADEAPERTPPAG
jgi:hypothetical protein